MLGQTIFSHRIDYSDATQHHTLWTKRGDQLIGRLVSIQNDIISFRLRNLETVLQYRFNEVIFVGMLGESLPYAKLSGQYINPKGEVTDAPFSQLTYSSTALPNEGRGSYKNTMVLVNDIERHISKYFTVAAGAAIPGIVYVRANAKVSVIKELVHIGVGAHTYFSTYYPEIYFHPYGILTLGNKDNFLNFTYGSWRQNISDDFFGNFEKQFPIVSIGGSYRLNKNWRIMSENVATFGDFNKYVLPSFVMSYWKRRHTIEFGLFALPEIGVPMIPLVSYRLQY